MTYWTEKLKIEARKKLWMPFDEEADTTYPEWIEEYRHIYKNDFRRFVIDFFPYAGVGANQCDPGIVVDAASEIVHGLEDDHFKLVLFSCPSREAKSTIFEVLLPAWKWIRDPNLTFLTISYAYSYATRDNLYMQRLIESEPFQLFFGKDFKLTIKNKERTFTNKGGQRIACSVAGRLTAEGGRYIIGDDINSLLDRYFDKKLAKVNSFVEDVLITRMNQASKAKLLLVQHRNSPFDCIGNMLQKEVPGMIYVPLRMEYVKSKPTIIRSWKTGEELWRDPRYYEGQLLSPNRVGEKDLNFIKSIMGKSAYQAVYQCDPTVADTNVFKSEWFKIWDSKTFPSFKYIISSWDTATSSDMKAAQSACTNWGIFNDRHGNLALMLISIWTGQKEWNELRHMAIRISRNIFDVNFDYPRDGFSPPTKILVEDHSSGRQLIQSLNKINIMCTPYRPPKRGGHGNTEDGKVIRARHMAPYVESGRIYVMPDDNDPESPRPYAQHFINACTTFPSNLGDIGTKDIVDTFTQVIDFLQMQGELKTMEEGIRSLHGPLRNVI